MSLWGGGFPGIGNDKNVAMFLTLVQVISGGVSLSIYNKFHSRVLSVPPGPVEHVFVLVKIYLNYIVIENA